MERHVIVQKEEGETPLAALERFRSTRTELAGIPMTYAGRLDPMAHGSLIILIGDACKERDAYTALDKEYVFEILFGVSTDTADILGIVQKSMPSIVRNPENCVSVGEYRMPYPAFSSKTVNGKSLFQYALEGTLDTITIPETNMTVRSVVFDGSRPVGRDELLSNIRARLGSIQGGAVNDFRKDDVLASWDTIATGDYTIARFTAVVSSGTYIRSLSEMAGYRIGVPALAYSIERTGFRLPPSGVSSRILCTDILLA